MHGPADCPPERAQRVEGSSHKRNICSQISAKILRLLTKICDFLQSLRMTYVFWACCSYSATRPDTSFVVYIIIGDGEGVADIAVCQGHVQGSIGLGMDAFDFHLLCGQRGIHIVRRFVGRSHALTPVFPDQHGPGDLSAGFQIKEQEGGVGIDDPVLLPLGMW